MYWRYRPQGIVHEKISVCECDLLDGSKQAIALSGSYNWTMGARNKNLEDCVAVKSHKFPTMTGLGSKDVSLASQALYTLDMHLEAIFDDFSHLVPQPEQETSDDERAAGVPEAAGVAQ